MLAQVMGHDFDYASPVKIFEELTRVSPVHQGMSGADFGETGKQWQTV
jgi:predicted molibdopterin-dependent oxidoreductase YjgC